MNHRQAQELLPVYVLGALEVPEQEELLDHLQVCIECYLLVQEAMEVGAMLASTIAEVDPPVTLKARVRSSLAALPTPDDHIE